jgi:hypothetical protein
MLEEALVKEGVDGFFRVVGILVVAGRGIEPCLVFGRADAITAVDVWLFPFNGKLDVLCIFEQPIALPDADVGEPCVRHPQESWEVTPKLSPNHFSGGFGVSVHIMN